MLLNYYAPCLIFAGLCASMHCNQPDMADKTHIILRPNKWATLQETHFFHSTDGRVGDSPVKVRLMADDEYLHIAFECEDNPYLEENDMTEHNQPLYNQEVFEVFIGAGSADPDHYTEIEINPNNALWIGRIAYPSLGEKNDMKGELIPYTACGIAHTVEKGQNRWRGTLDIPWKLIAPTRQSDYRINFYRIVSRQSHPQRGWVCDAKTCDFLCWNATMSGKDPAFHRPKRFGFMKIIDE